MPKRKARVPSFATDESSPELQRQTTVIVPNGDLYMVFNDEDNETGRLLVSRYILCLCSKVFDAMIGDSARFREATEPSVSVDGLREVLCDDDDFGAMTTIMNILHLQHDRVPPLVSFKRLRETASICDKYDLTRSLGLWPGTWAQHYVDRIQKKGFEHWLFVASVFKQREAFTKITRHLILNCKIDAITGELETADDWSFSEGVPSTVIEQMAHLRARTHVKLRECLWQRFESLRSTGKGRRLCYQYDERKAERSDLEREQCDTWNLGCLTQYFPDLKEPREEDEEHGTIMAVMKRIDAMEEFQNTPGYILSEGFVKSHFQGTSCGNSCGNLPSRMRNYVAKVEGLNLES